MRVDQSTAARRSDTRTHDSTGSARELLASRKLVRVLPGWRPGGTFAERIYALRPYSSQAPRAVDPAVRFLHDRLAGGFPIQKAAY